MGRTAYAFRDLDEELHDDFVHIYETHSSPPSQAATSKVYHKSLNDSMVLRQYVDHQRTMRRRKMLGGALFVGAALLGAVPLIIQAQAGDSETNELELMIAAPYKALRSAGDDLHQGYSSPVDEEGLRIDRVDNIKPSVGDFDPCDTELADATDTDELITGQEEVHANDGEGEEEDDEEQADDEPSVEATLLRIDNGDDDAEDTATLP